MANASIKKLDKDVRELLVDVTEGLKEAAEKTGDEGIEAIRRSAESLARAARRLLDESRETGANLAKRAKKETQEHPMVAAALVVASAAALVGFIATRNMGSSSSAAE